MLSMAATRAPRPSARQRVAYPPVALHADQMSGASDVEQQTSAAIHRQSRAPTARQGLIAGNQAASPSGSDGSMRSGQIARASVALVQLAVHREPPG